MHQTTGKKEVLIARLQEEAQGDDGGLAGASEEQLKQMCMERGLRDDGPRDVLERRVRDDMAYVLEMSCRKLAAAQQAERTAKAAAREGSKKKHEFTITSLNYEPIKFTAGGGGRERESHEQTTGWLAERACFFSFQ